MKWLRLSLLIFTLLLSTKSAFANLNQKVAPKTEQIALTPQKTAQKFDLKKVFASSPIIYSILLLMSSSALSVWLYTQATFRANEIMPEEFLIQIRRHLNEKNFDEAHRLCQKEPNLLANILSVGLTTRKLGPIVMIDAMKSEGKRVAATFWQRLSILNDIAIIAPMLGLLGTVIGMFYAFYDVNRSIDSINAVFDGLGVSVGTTVVGLIVAILSMILATTLKYRLLKNFSLVENEALSLSTRIEAN